MKQIYGWFERWQPTGKIADGGAELQRRDTAKTVRAGADGGPVVTDGPYLELKEVIGGFVMLECDDIDEAARIAATWPRRRRHDRGGGPSGDGPRVACRGGRVTARRPSSRRPGGTSVPARPGSSPAPGPAPPPPAPRPDGRARRSRSARAACHRRYPASRSRERVDLVQRRRPARPRSAWPPPGSAAPPATGPPRTAGRTAPARRPSWSPRTTRPGRAARRCRPAPGTAPAGPGAPPPAAAAPPAPMVAWSHRRRSWSFQQHDAAPRVEPRGRARASCSSSSAASPATSGSRGQQRGELAGQLDALAGQLAALDGPAAGQVPLVEHQVDHREHGRQPVGVLGRVGHLEPDAALPQLALGPGEPLRHRRHRHQERGGDLGGAQAAGGVQRQRDPGRLGRGRDGSRRRPSPAGRRRPAPGGGSARQLRQLLPADGLAAQPVQRLAPAGGDQPTGRAAPARPRRASA